jgi:transcriptional regulator with XRE-family HTH domain
VDNDQVLRAVGRQMQRLRKTAGLSQDELANQVELHRNYIGLIERGERNPTLLNLAKIAHALGVPLATLFEDLGS